MEQSLPRFRQKTVSYMKFMIDERYSKMQPIGDGSYGMVVSALDKQTGRKVAIKKIKDAFIDMVDAKRILREMKLLRHLQNHENIINVVDIMTVPPGSRTFDDIYIVTDLFESDLSRIIKSPQGLTEQHFQYFIYQILRGLKYMHGANILHRDLKPSNLLVNANCDLAICDFGLARGFDEDSSRPLTEYVVTRWYRAPELLCDSPHYGKKMDIWSVGCILAELVKREPMFQGDSPSGQLLDILGKIGCPAEASSLPFVRDSPCFEDVQQFETQTPPPFASLFPPGTSENAISILQGMLQFDPEARMSAEEALEHPYLGDFHGQMPEPICEEPFDFDFERGDAPLDTDLTEAEIQSMMFDEVLRFRPYYESYTARSSEQKSSSSSRSRSGSKSKSSSSSSSSSSESSSSARWFLKK